MRARIGESLAETLMALFILGLILPPIFQSQSGGLMAVESLRRMDACQYGAQWWFSRLPDPVTEASLAAMPTATPAGDVNFTWEAQSGDYGSLVVTLAARAGASGAPLSLTRAY